ncbi:hypothetical protein [Mesorhizobium sp. M3A.F.Ca.ET.080.04.2.1]|uniref:hypothetical protein n=1 Tax=Mesorhizobium sp. M3A.F.Ca.ET.080.04.2.1 TaxID=2493676 RepID=UPI0013EADFBC
MVWLFMPNDLAEIAIDRLAALPAGVEVILFAARVATMSAPGDGRPKVRKLRHPCNFLASRSNVLRSLPCSPINSLTWWGVMRCRFGEIADLVFLICRNAIAVVEIPFALVVRLSAVPS